MSATSYNNQEPKSFPYEDESEDRTGVSAFLASHFKRHDDLRTMLDSSKDSQKLDAMKRIVGMMASGRDVSELFPAVVKNVVSKSIEVKKLVYVYLVRYAEEQQDLALLSISTFQRALKDPNQLIRASALRVLSSIRVPVIVPIMMLSLKEAVTDLSPYVRKTAANAIPKLYSMDPEQRDILIEIIEKLLQDKTTLVIGSAVTAFDEVCPDRIDLIHKNYRKMCNMLIDIDEWGQVAVVNMLTRYARSQFLDPNKTQTQGNEEAAFYPSSESEKSEEEEEEEEEKKKAPAYTMDPDHRLLLRSSKSLLQSRNAAVVMAVVKLYHHCAPSNEVNLVIRALIRLLRSHREVQTVVLSNVASMSVSRKGLFEPHIKSFFVHSGDPTHIKLLKLEILTNIATESSISMILKEFQTYVTSSDKQFAASTIQAIGRCAANIPEVTDTCLGGLVRLLSNRDESVVGESVVVIKKLLQTQRADHSEIIIHMAKLIDKINVPMARASILWLIGEYSERVPKIAPDVLRKMAKSFSNEDSIVKLQVLNLGAKLFLTNSKQVKLLCQYVLQLAKYDTNYDIRDRGRFIRFVLFPPEDQKENGLRKKGKKLFLSEKPAPILESVFKGWANVPTHWKCSPSPLQTTTWDRIAIIYLETVLKTAFNSGNWTLYHGGDRGQYQVGSLSHLINARAQGYQDLPDFPEAAPDPTVRDVEVDQGWGTSLFPGATTHKKKTSFYSDSDEGEEGDSDEDSSDEDSDDEDDDSEEDDEDEEEEDDDDIEIAADTDATKTGKAAKKPAEEAMEDDSEEESDSSEEDSDEESDDDSEEETAPKVKQNKEQAGKSARNQQSYDQLLDLDDFTSEVPVPPIPSSGVLTPSLVSEMESLSLNANANTHSVYTGSIPDRSKTHELLKKIAGQGLSGEYVFLRAPCIHGSQLVAVEIILKNNSSLAINNIKVDTKRLSSGLNLVGFQEIASLAADQTMNISVGVDFRDTTQPANFDICTQTSKFAVSIKPPVGELIQKHPISEQEFLKEQVKLTGMNENSLTVTVPSSLLDPKTMSARIFECTNMAIVSGFAAGEQDKVFRFAGKLISSGVLVLLTVKCTASGTGSMVIVNCDKISIGSLLSKEIKNTISKV